MYNKDCVEFEKYILLLHLRCTQTKIDSKILFVTFKHGQTLLKNRQSFVLGQQNDATILIGALS